MPAAATRQQSRSRQQEESPTSALVVSSRGMSLEEALTRVSSSLEQRTEQLLTLVDDPKTVERLKLVALHALTDPNLASKLVMADLATIIEAVREAAMNDLMPTGFNGEAYLVPYWNADKGLFDIQFQPGWRGLTKLLEETCEIASGIAYERDTVFEFELGSREWVRHVPALKDRGERLAAWADATILRSGNHRVEVMDMAQLEERRKASKMADRGAWRDWPDPMYRKTVVRAISNRVPVSKRLQRLLEHDARVEAQASLPPGEAAEPRRIHAVSGPAARARQLLGIGGPAGAPDGAGQAAGEGDGQAPPRQQPTTTGSDAAPSDVGSGRGEEVGRSQEWGQRADEPPHAAEAPDAGASSPDRPTTPGTHGPEVTEAPASAPPQAQGPAATRSSRVQEDECGWVPESGRPPCFKARGHKGDHATSEGRFPR